MHRDLFFEKGIGFNALKDGNRWYNYSSCDDLLNNLDDLKFIIEDFLSSQVSRLSLLDSYTKGRNFGILSRRARKEDGKADYRVCHNFGGYVSQFITGYLFGIPVRVESDDEKTNEVIKAFNDLNEIDGLNSNLGFDCSVFGRAFELHYRNEKDEDRCCLSSVFETFVIYDLTVEHKPIMAIRCPKFSFKNKSFIKVTCYTKDFIINFSSCDANNIKLVEESRKRHFYNDIPVIEWVNNRFRNGDFENALSLIDLYDSSQSDTANYMNDFNDALLVIKGDINSNSYSVDDIKKLKDANMLVLSSGFSPDGHITQTDAGYIYKQYDVNGMEAYKKRLEKDIHKFTHTPDLSDENFSGNSSGVAMKYKVFGLEQMRSSKERAFKKCIRKRYELLNNLHQYTVEPILDLDNFSIVFSENVPIDFWQDINQFISAGGELSQKTLLDMLPWIDNSDDEIKKIDDEKESNIKRASNAFDVAGFTHSHEDKAKEDF
ncbi:MAG: phage portal protein [Peptoniphilaceae bacterium]|nr:phage portal protein [Peptoniphilaceae bacterium]